jgi:hypothetical protein
MQPNQLGPQRNDASFGYFAPYITSMANTRRWAQSIDENNSIVVEQSYPLQLVATSPIDLLNNCKIAAQGSAVKSIVTGSGGAADATLTLGAVKSFGVHVRISDSPLNFKFGSYNVTLKDGATDLGSVYVLANRLPVDIYLLGVSNSGGQAQVTSINNPVVVVQGSTNGSSVTTTTALWAETLNMRDIGQAYA